MHYKLHLCVIINVQYSCSNEHNKCNHCDRSNAGLHATIMLNSLLNMPLIIAHFCIDYEMTVDEVMCSKVNSYNCMSLEASSNYALKW